MINTGRLYSLAEDTLTEQIDYYYQRLERESYYQDQMNRLALNRWEECKYGWSYLKDEFQKKGPSIIPQYQWLFDPKSKDYIDLKMFVQMSKTVVSRSRIRVGELVFETEELITAIENELKRSE